MSQSVSRADLHIHTMASDGTASVSQVLARAEEVGLDRESSGETEERYWNASANDVSITNHADNPT